jgi:hypothetical protein
MESTTSLIEPLLERIQEYSKTSLELLKLQALDKTAQVSSLLVSRSLLIIFLVLFSLTLNTGIALWLGDILGRNYLGFFLVASFYGFIAAVLVFLHPWIRERVSHAVITQMRS